MVSMLTSSVVCHGFEYRTGQTKTLKLVFAASPLSTKYAALRIKSRDWMARNQDNLSEFNNMSTYRLLFSELAL